MQVLIETRMNSLKLTESKTTKKGCIGRLEGVCADFKSPTRNGRLYPLDLWKKVFADPLFKESLENKTLYGELDHPEDRFEPLITEACVVMTDYKIDEDAGVIYGGFDILDTPKGRILKTVLDYGSVVGVSSRGQGDIIESADGEKVDEDSYEFACFDVVSTPAVEKARQKVTESIKRINKQSFTESVKNQISEADSVADLNIIRSVVRTSKLEDSDMDSLIESIEDKCKSLQTAGETISEKVESEIEGADSITESAKTIRDNKKLYGCIRSLREKVSAYKHRESRYVETIGSKDDEISMLKGKVKKLEQMNKMSNKKHMNVKESLDRKISKSDTEIRKCESLVESLKSKNKRLTEQLENRTSEISRIRIDNSGKVNQLQEMLDKSKDRVDYLEKQLETLKESHETDMESIDNEVEDYTRLLNEAQTKIDNGAATIKDLRETIDSKDRMLKTAVSRNKKLSESVKAFQESYLKKVSNVMGINPESIKSSISEDMTPKQIENIVESMRDRIDRHNKTGIASRGIDVNGDYTISSTENSKQSEDDSRLMSFLSTAQNSL